MGERLKRLKDKLMEDAGMASMLEVYGTGKLLLTGCRSLMDFDDCTVTVCTVDGTVTVFGSCLEITAFRADLICVSGCISRVEFGEKL